MNAQQIIEDMESLSSEMQSEALDFIRFLKAKSGKTLTATPNSQNVAEIMGQIASRASAFQGLDNPVLWQKQQRQDRALPGRD